MPPLTRAFLAATLSLCAPSTGIAAPLITEFMAANDSVIYDEDGNSSDWIEIHNPDSSPVDLDGYYLTDDSADLSKWALPGVTLPAGGYLIVFASNKDRDVGELHTNFRLSPDAGGYLALVAPDGSTLLSEFASYPEQFPDFSYGLAQTGGSTNEVLVREGDACRILVPTSDIGSVWQALAFDDGSWLDGTTGVGYERSSGYQNLIGAGGDVEAQSYGTNSTVYVRIPFSVASKDGMSRLLFRMKYDDGFIAYLNGVEIASGNKPASPTWNSDASGDHPDGQATQFVDTDISTQIDGALAEGNNVLAIHSMNDNTTSSDLLALPRLEAEVVAAPGGIGGAGHFQTASPGTANGTDQGLPAGDVTVSPAGRGFTGTLGVTLSTGSPSAQIRFTTDGNVPTASSTLYTGGTINVTSSTLVRARAFQAGLTPGRVSEEGFIRLSSDAQSFSSDIPVVVMERFSSGGPTAANGKAFTFFAFFEPDPATGRTTLNKPYSLGTRGGWKVRGSSSSGFAKKAFSIEAWNEDNRNKDIAPLGMPEESDWILNARSVFDRSLMRNAFIYELSNQTGRYAVRTQFVELFKDDNGGDLSFAADYDGVYTFMEKISRDPMRVDVERLPASVSSEPGVTGGYMLKIDRADPGDSGFGGGGQTVRWVYPKEEDATAAQAGYISNFLNEMNASLSTSDYADYIDVDSWVDHHLLNVLALNADALRLSTYFHKKRNGRLEFGPIWDFDRSMESTDGRDNNPSTWSGGTAYFTFPWWGTLFEDENFWQVYIDRYFELRDGAWGTANIHGIIDGMAAELDEAQVRNFQRWSDQPRFGSYQGEVNHLKDWLATRLTWMDGQFAPRPTASRAPGVYPAGTTVTLNAPSGGNRTIYYTLDGTDPRPPAGRTIINGTEVIDENHPVRVLVPNSDIGTGWRTDIAFADDAWISGSGGIGYERSSGYDTHIDIDLDTQMANNTSVYVRRVFSVTSDQLDEWNSLTLQMRYDDGFVAYLNGQLVASDRAPSPASWNSSATQTHDDGAATIYQTFDISSALDDLVPGENLLGIHALNESTGSSDFLNQAKLVGSFDENAGGGDIDAIEYTGPITLDETSRLFARVFDSDGGHTTNSGQTPVGTGWSAPLRAEYLVDETPAVPGDLAITEILADPYASDHPEWLEITNISAGTVSLTDVTFVDGIEFTFGGISLPAGGSVVITDDLAEFEHIYGTARLSVVAGVFDGSLDNGGERLEIGFAGGGASSIDYPGGSEDGRSLVADGGGFRPGRCLLGSPGKPEPTTAELPDVFVNELVPFPGPPDTTDWIEIRNTGTGRLELDGWFVTTDLSQPEMYQIESGIGVNAGDEGAFAVEISDFFDADSGGGEIFLIAAEPDGTRLDYVHGFTFGDAQQGHSFARHVTSTGEVFYPLFASSLNFPNQTPIATRLVISELMYHPADGGSEFVEIVNNSNFETIPLAGVRLEGTGFTFPPGAPDLGPDEVVLLVADDPETFRASNGVPSGVPIFGPYPAVLDNGGESLRLKIPAPGEGAGAPDLLPTWDHVRYDDQAPWPTAPDGTGESLHRRFDYAGVAGIAGFGSDPANWESAPPSPGVVGEPPGDWRAMFFTPGELADLSISGPLADADGDALNNLLEYLMGSDPRDAASTAAVEISEAGGDIFIDVPLRDGVIGYDLVLEQSDALETWGASPAGVETTLTGAGVTTTRYRDPTPPAVRNYRARAVETP